MSKKSSSSSLILWNSSAGVSNYRLWWAHRKDKHFPSALHLEKHSEQEEFSAEHSDSYTLNIFSVQIQTSIFRSSSLLSYPESFLTSLVYIRKQDHCKSTADLCPQYLPSCTAHICKLTKITEQAPVKEGQQQYFSLACQYCNGWVMVEYSILLKIHTKCMINVYLLSVQSLWYNKIDKWKCSRSSGVR